MKRTTTETGAAIKRSQTVVPTWLSETVETGGGDDALFAVTRDHTPFGTYLVGIAPASHTTA